MVGRATPEPKFGSLEEKAKTPTGRFTPTAQRLRATGGGGGGRGGVTQQVPEKIIVVRPIDQQGVRGTPQISAKLRDRFSVSDIGGKAIIRSRATGQVIATETGVRVLKGKFSEKAFKRVLELTQQEEGGKLIQPEEGAKLTTLLLARPEEPEKFKDVREAEFLEFKREEPSEEPKDFQTSVEDGSQPEEEPITEREAEAEFNSSLALPGLGEALAEKPIQQTISGVGEGMPNMDRFFTEPPVSDVRAAPKPEGFFETGFDILARERFKVFKARAKGDITLKTALTGVGLGLGTVLLGTALGTKEFATHPIETTTKTIAAIPVAAEFVTSGGLTQLILQEPGFVLGFVGGEIAQAQLGGGVVLGVSSRARRLIARVSPKFKPVKVEALGVQKIKGVKIAGKKVDIGLIPGGKGLKLDVDNLLKKVDIPLEPKPRLPKLTPTQKSILNVVRKQDDLLTGSLAQKTLCHLPL